VLLTVTEEHPLQDAETFQWVQARNLRVGQQLVTLGYPAIAGTTDPEMTTPDEAEILGYLLTGTVHGNDVAVRKLKNEHLEARRLELFRRAGWNIKDFSPRCYLVYREDGEMATPADALKSWAYVRNGWTVEVLPEVYALNEQSIRRLLYGAFSAAYMRRCEDERSAYGGTVGVGVHRSPKYVSVACKETALMLHRLLLRMGVDASLKRMKFCSSKQHRGLWATEADKHSPYWKLDVPSKEVERFWPTERVHEKPESPHRAHKIVRIEKLRTMLPTWAVEVDDPCHSYISNGAMSHNTNQVAIGHVLWRIGKNPDHAIGIFCNSREMAGKIVYSLKEYIQNSEELHDVFPNLLPSADRWAQYAFNVRRTTFRKDPTVQAISLKGKFVGARLDGLVMDDVDNVDTTLTKAARDDTEKRVRTQLSTRLSDTAWAVAIGNVWFDGGTSDGDLMHRLARSGWTPLRFPVWDIHTHEPTDPEMFPKERIIAIRDEDVGPLEFQRLYELKSKIDGEQRFKPEWIDAALLKGKQSTLADDGIPSIPLGCRTITGVDLGIKAKASSDPTAITTIMEVPQGSRYEYVLLNIVTGRWHAQEIMDRIVEQQRLFGSTVFVESNGGQDFLIQLLNMSNASIPVKSFNTGRNKHDPMFGVESIASALAQGLWTFPSWDGTRDSAEEELSKLIEEMLAYVPGAVRHTGDVLMSLWIACEGARSLRQKNEGRVEVGRLRLRR